MKNYHLILMERVFAELQDTKDTKFNYFVARNERIVKEELEVMRKSLANDRFAEYNKKRMNINMEMCEKKEDGSPVIVRDNFVIPDEVKSVYNEKMNELDAEYKDSIEENKIQIKQFNDLMEEDMAESLEAQFRKVKLSSIPDNVTKNQMHAFLDLIVED